MPILFQSALYCADLNKMIETELKSAHDLAPAAGAAGATAYAYKTAYNALYAAYDAENSAAINAAYADAVRDFTAAEDLTAVAAHAHAALATAGTAYDALRDASNEATRDVKYAYEITTIPCTSAATARYFADSIPALEAAAKVAAKAYADASPAYNAAYATANAAYAAKACATDPAYNALYAAHAAAASK